jgi:hypothetical protein
MVKTTYVMYVHTQRDSEERGRCNYNSEDFSCLLLFDPSFMVSNIKGRKGPFSELGYLQNIQTAECFGYFGY